MVLGTFLRLALRNLRRNRARSAITLGAIFLGVAMTVVLSSFGNGLGQLMANDAVKAKVGAIQIHRKGYAQARDNQPLDLDMPETGELPARLRAVPGVAAIAPRVTFGGLLNNGRESTMVVVRGVDPDREYEALPWADRTISGHRVRSGEAHRGLGVFGKELADALGAAPGKGTLILQAPTRTGQQNALDVEVAGTFDNLTVFEAKRLLDVPLAFAQDLVRMPGRVTEWVVRVDDLDNIDGVVAALARELGPEYEVESWKVLRPSIADVIRFQQIIVRIVALVFLVIVIFGVVNTMVMSVLERTREIGTMLAVGVRRRQVSLLFLLEAAFLALLGGGLGAGVGRLVVWAVEAAGGVKMAAPGQTEERLHLVPIVPAGLIQMAFIGATVGALLAALYPAWRASRLRPVDALRAN